MKKQKEMRQKTIDNKKSDVAKFREKWLKKGFELVNITTLCEVILGNSGWCNDFNEPDETCHHIQIRYREEVIANVHANSIYPIDDNYYVVFSVPDINGDDFIIFRKVKKND